MIKKIKLSNYIKHEYHIPESIDKTIDQIMRKKTYLHNKSGNINLIADFGLIRSINIFEFNIIDYHLGNLFEVPKWYRNEYRNYKDSKYDSHFRYVCDCCGCFSYEPFCKRCDYKDYRRRLEGFVKERNYEEALKIIIDYSKRK